MNPRLYRLVRSPLTEDQLTPPEEGCDCVQFDSPLSERDLLRLGAFLREFPSLGLRIYGHHGQREVDLEVLAHFPFVGDFAVELWNLDNLAGLRHLSPDLKGLSIGTRKRFSLKSIGRFGQLERLSFDGHAKDFEVVGDLAGVRELSLRGVTLKSLSTLAKLQSLESFRLRLGGTRNLAGLRELLKLHKLEIAMIRGLSDISVIADLEPLEHLRVSFLPRLESFPSLARLRRLQSVYIEKLPGLQDLKPIADAPALERFTFVEMSKLPIDAFQSFVGHQTLKKIRGGLSSFKRNRLLKARFPFVDVAT